MTEPALVPARATRPARVLAATLLLLATACSSTAHLRYTPAPLEYGVDAPGLEEPVARALIAITEAGDDGSGALELRLRLRLENLSDRPVALDRESFVLVAADLSVFGPARVEPEGSAEVPPGETRVFEVAFLFPDGLEAASDGMSGLNLRWGLRWDGRVLPVGSDFRRQAPPDEGWWPPTFFSVGVGVSF